MKAHYKKMVAPIIIALICIVYLLFYGFVIIIDVEIPLIIKALFGLIPLGLVRSEEHTSEL